MDSPADTEQPVVLAADDEEDILELIVFRLERSGYTVLQAHDGAEALEIARSSKPDLAVLDVMMPKMDGFELTRRLREDEATIRITSAISTRRRWRRSAVRTRPSQRCSSASWPRTPRSPPRTR